MRVLFGLIIFISGLTLGILISPRILSQNSAAVAQTENLVPTPPLVDETVYRQVNAQDQVISTVYERVSPSVVHITSHRQAFNMFYGVVPQEGTGSGFVYNDAGYIVTNHHVIADATQVDVLLPGNVSQPAQIVGTDAYYDLAVLKIEVDPNNLTPLEFADSSALRVGQTVIAIGNPFGLDRTLTTGVISALGRRIETNEGYLIGEAIQTDAAINPGNSGGPLLDVYGRVVGINTAINSPSGGSVGIGFAVPADIVQRVVSSLITDGYYAHPSLGVNVLSIGSDITVPADWPQQGLLVVEASPSAQQAGIQAAEVAVQYGRYIITGGDIITAINEHPVTQRNDLQLILEENYRPGDSVTLNIWREGQSLSLPVTLEAQ